MKKIFLVLLCTLFVFSFSWARQRSLENAEDIARSAMLQGKGMKSKMLVGQVQNIRMVRSSAILKRADVTANHEAFYFCIPEQTEKGYVLVSADDRMPEVLAVSDEAVFDENDIPENMQSYLQDYAEALKQIEAGTISSAEAFRAAQWLPLDTQIEPLLGDIKYNQTNPYNQMCPLRPSTNTRPATGCVATAMAQVMRYYKWPTDYGEGSTSYTSISGKDTIKVSYDFSKVKFDWDNMLGTYSKLTEEYTGTTDVGVTEYVTYTDMSHTTNYNIVLQHFAGVSEDGFGGYVQLILTDDKGNFLQPIGTKKTLSSLKYKSYYSTYTLTCSMPGSYPDGNYRMYVGVMHNDVDEWNMVKKASSVSTCYTASARTENYISIVKKGNNFTLSDGTVLACEYTQTNADAVAQLMAACGASLSMQYGSSSSASTSNIPIQLINRFYYAGDAFYLGKSWCSDYGWHQRIQEEVAESRPLIIRGENPTGTSGHAFVIDGFCYIMDEPYYHVNWGWGGSSNGYFLITTLKPSEAGTGGSTVNYSNSNAVVLNMRPFDGEQLEQALGCKGMTVNDTTYAMPGGSFEVTVSSVQNISPQPFAGNVYLCLLDSARNEVAKLAGCYSTTSMKKGYYFSSAVTATCTVPSSLPLGDYTVTVAAISANGVKTRVYNAYEKTIHVVDEDPTSKMPGKLRYYFETANHTARVRRFSNVPSANISQYAGDIVINDTIRFGNDDYEVVGIADSAFYNCTETSSVTMSEHNRTIGNYAFYGCTGLTSVQMTNHVSEMGKYTFYGCTALKSINLSDSITVLPTYAFSTSGIQKIKIPEGVTSIAMRAFEKCTALEEVTLPSTLTILSAYSFNGCTGIKKIYAKMKNPMKIATNVWKGVNTDSCTLYVPKGCIANYTALATWKNFVHIEEIPDNAGDLNGDGSVNVGDLTLLVGMIMDGYSTMDDAFDCADMNEDGVLNVGDITLMVNKIMNPEAE